MALKSLAEIAFDGHECFAKKERKFGCRFSELSDEDKLMFERIAGRVQAETILRKEESTPSPSLFGARDEY